MTRRSFDGPRVITLLAARGGCGKTTFATNLAVALRDSDRRVCLVDLDFAHGDLARTLRMGTERTLGGAARGSDAVTTQYLPGIDCVLAPVRPGEAARVPDSRVGELLDELAAGYDHLVVDTPAFLAAPVLAATDRADHHVLVAIPELPVLNAVRDTLDTLDLLGYRQTARSIVVNRADPHAGLATEDMERALRGRVACWVPVSRDVPTSRNQGLPLALTAPKHAVSVAVRGFAESLLVATEPHDNAVPAFRRAPPERGGRDDIT